MARAKATRPAGGGDGRDGGRSGGGGGGKRPPVPVVVVDPRMRSRRIGVRRDAGRRRLKRLTLALSLVLVAVGALATTRTALLDVDRVTIEGVEHARVDEVLEVVGIAAGDPLISVDPDAVEARVEVLPWVARAQVERSWPSTVDVQVTERVPVAVVQVTDDHAAAVDAAGWVISIDERPADAPPGPLVLTDVDGRVAEGERLDGAARQALEVAAVVAERMPQVVASVSTDLDAQLVEGGTVRFGSTEDLDEKVTAVKTVLADVDTSCLELLDVRVPGSPALTRNQRCS